MAVTASTPSEVDAVAAVLDLTDLLIPFEAARRAACAAAAAGDWLDASLLAAGCSQVVEDHIHRSEGFLDRVAVHLAGDDPVPGRPSRAVGSAAAVIRTGHRALPRIAGLLDHRDQLNELAVRLSGLAAKADQRGAADAPAELDATDRILGPGAAWPAELADRTLRLPSSFRSFDQQPADVRALAALAAERWPDRSRPLLVVGIRTSGSYLAPIAVAELRRLGYRHAELITVRADERLDRSQAAAVARCASGTALLIDDPPVSGATVRDCIGPLVRAGMAPDRVGLLLALPQGWKLASFLDRYEQVILSGPDWRLEALMAAPAIAAVAAELLAARGLHLAGTLEPAADPVGPAPGGAPRTPREHRRAAFAVEVGGDGPAPLPKLLVVQGVGVGLFGRHDAAVAQRLADRAPDVLGVVDGLMYQLLDRPDPSPRPLEPNDVAGYVLDRHRRLPASVDRSEAMRGRKAAWEIAGMLVGGALGRADAAVRTALVHPIVQQILHVTDPSIIDGRMTTDRFLPTADGPRLKADFGDGAFSNRDLWCYDTVADLAAIADEMGRPADVLAAWSAAGGTDVDPSRWALLRLVGAWDRHRHGGLPQPEYGRTTSRILADHIGSLYLADLPAATGGWCVTDVDGVLETSVFAGASAPGRLGGESLRALAAHGLRLVPATGRSASEVADRCAAWHLPVGIAEYGSALVIGGEVVDLRGAGQVAAIDRARAWLDAYDDVVLDPAYQRCVRAWRTIDGRGRHPLLPDQIAGLTAALDGAITVVLGEDQTDLVATGISKDRAVVAMLERLDPAASTGARPLTLAVGDGPADIGLLGLGRRSVAPAHAGSDVRAAATDQVRGSYQQGFADAVALVIGHRPGTCPTCAPHLEAPSAALVDVLSVHEAGAAAMPTRMARLSSSAWTAARSRRGR